MSFFLTQQQIRDGTKGETRRLGCQRDTVITRLRFESI